MAANPDKQANADKHADSDKQGELDRLPGLGLLWAGIGAIGFVLTAFLVVGLLLPGTWTAETTRMIQAPPERVYQELADLGRWEAWTHWPELENVEDEVSDGMEVRRSWDDPNYGAGTLTLVERVPNQALRYEVRVEGGIDIDGSISLLANGAGTELVWTEVGAFGRNPLLRYTALSMDELQAEEMEKSLDRLAELVAGPRSD